MAGAELGRIPVRCTAPALILAVLLSGPSGAEEPSAEERVWIEKGDARSFPAQPAQRTLERGPLELIVGSLGPGVGDSRDAYVIRLAEPDAFSIEVEADFQLHWELLDRYGAPAWEPFPGEAVLVVEAAGRGGVYALQISGAKGAGPLDIVLAVEDYEMDRYCLATALAGNFHCHGVTGDELKTHDVELADFDHDGDLDAVFATKDAAEPNRICPGDSVGRFSFEECLPIGEPGASSREVKFGDLNNDGDLDLVFANSGAQEVACLGDGALGFTCQAIALLPSRGGRAVDLGHFDDDGSLDAIFATSTIASLCLGDGAGGFSSCTDLSGLDSQRDVAVGRFDGDVHLDALFATQGGGWSCLGNGSGSLSCSETSHLAPFTRTVTIGFLDDDANVDVVSVVETGTSACLGDGTGDFTCAPFDEGHPDRLETDIALADFDNDGELDVAVSAKWEPGVVCFGDGAGSFGSCSPINENHYGAQSLAIGALAAASVGWDDFETGDLRAWATAVPVDP